MKHSSLLLILATLAATSAAHAAGVSVGSSTLIGQLQYSDTFTVGTPARPDGLYNNNGSGGYNIETVYSTPAATWTPFSNFSFNSGGGSTCCGYPDNTGAAGGGSAAASGLAQSGGGDFSIPYGLSSKYVVQVDAVLPPDRLDIGSYNAAGDSIFAGNSLSVFFRRMGTPHPEIGLFNGALESNSGFTTGILGSDTSWHNFAVEFDRPANSVAFYVDEVLRGSLNLTTFAGGVYQNYANNAVGLGGTFVFWADNFQVGAPVPEPATGGLAALASLALLRRRRK